MITDGLMLGLLFSGVLLILGLKFQSRAVVFISSLGWMICGLQIFQQTDEILPTLLLMMLSFAQFVLIGGNKE